ncbi:hypothetical protein K503DRAFT_576641 [Rhizopogon vinicolor AM-OR11-026]|uniref:Uncharacterized protein n=1 Tax=Rhizopogon vinicolor AM-OR11-026 TaxID=1314800 RepID=A0A1B7MJL8_9AGAM|nr:hypothetical protein K503DRAFT_576641 [Rhizopogon vinicolor AM-OR11-026]
MPSWLKTNITWWSAESSLGAGGRLVGEGLRATGIGMRNGNRTTDDLFGQANNPQVSLRCARTTVSSTNRTVEWEDEDRITDDMSRASGSSTPSDGAGLSARRHLSSNRSRAPPILLEERDSTGGRTVSSMAEFYHGEGGNIARGMTFSLRSKRQVLGVERDRQPPGESLNSHPLPLQ